MTFLFRFLFFPSKASRLGARADTVVQRRADRAERPADESPQRVASLPLLPLQTLARRRLPRVHRYVLISSRLRLFLSRSNVRLHLLLFAFYPPPRISLQSSSIPCPGTSAASETECCTPAAKTPWWTWWRTTSRLRSRRRWEPISDAPSAAIAVIWCQKNLTQAASVFVQLGLCTCECRGVGRHQSHWKSFEEKKSHIRKQNCWKWKSVSDWPAAVLINNLMSPV